MTTSPNNRLVNEALFAFLVIAFTAYYLLAWTKFSVYYVDLRDYINGEERLPFQYRVLMAWIGHWLTPLFAPFAHIDVLPETYHHVPESLVYICTNAVFTGSSVYVARACFHSLGISGRPAWILSLALFIPLYFNAVISFTSFNFIYPYDAPQMLFFGMALLALIRCRPVLFAAITLLAMVNKETAILLPVLFFLWHRGDMPTRRLLVWTLLMLSACLVIKLGIYQLYDGNPAERPGDAATAVAGGLFTNQIGNNIAFFSSPLHLLRLMSVFGYVWLIIVLGWKWLQHRALARSLLVFPLMMSIMLVAGRLTELRIFIELTMLFHVTAGLVVWNWISNQRKEPQANC